MLWLVLLGLGFLCFILAAIIESANKKRALQPIPIQEEPVDISWFNPSEFLKDESKANSSHLN